MKRRAFLGFLGGAAAVGPTVGAKLASDLAGASAGSMGVGYGIPSGSIASATSSGGDWRLSRIAQLRDMLSGKDNKEAANQRRMSRMYQAESMERFRLDGLRSVSGAHKMQMLVNGNLDRQERMNRIHAETELENLLSNIF